MFLIGIRLYQRYVSPYKGFRCSHAAFFGGKSCSGAIYALILRKGIVAAWPLIRQQFAECSWAHQVLSYMQEKESPSGNRRCKPSREADDTCRMAGACFDLFETCGDCNPFK
ncbi:MAG: membrane protein insertion efficiency factor YidD [Deinococcaceae bacterium]